MEDIYNYNNSQFHRVFGGANYVTESREITKEKLIEMGKEFGYTITFDPHSQSQEISDEDFNHVRHEAYQKSYYVAPAKPEKMTEQEQYPSDKPTMTLNVEKNGVEIRFPQKPDSSILTILKNNGFRWSKPQGIWYAKQAPAIMKIAKQITA